MLNSNVGHHMFKELRSQCLLQWQQQNSSSYYLSNRSIEIQNSTDPKSEELESNYKYLLEYLTIMIFIFSINLIFTHACHANEFVSDFTLFSILYSYTIYRHFMMHNVLLHYITIYVFNHTNMVGSTMNASQILLKIKRFFSEVLVGIFIHPSKKLMYEIFIVDGIPCAILIIILLFFGDILSSVLILMVFSTLALTKKYIFFGYFSEICIVSNLDDKRSSSSSSISSTINISTKSTSSVEPKHKNKYINALCMNCNFLIFFLLFVMVKYVLSVPYFLFRNDSYFHSWYFLLLVNVYYCSSYAMIDFPYIQVLVEYVLYVVFCVFNILHLVFYGFMNGYEFGYCIFSFAMLYVLWIKLVFKVLGACENPKLS